MFKLFIKSVFIYFVIIFNSYSDEIEVVCAPWLFDKAAVFKSLPIILEVIVDLPAPEFPTKSEHLPLKKLTNSSILLPYFAEQSITCKLIFL